MGGATIGFRTCILDAMPTSADESISAPLAQFSTVALPSVQERVQTGITGTAHCRPQDPNEDLYRKTAHNNQYECSNDVRNVLPRKLESTACATRASANEFLNDLARCQSQLDHLNYCLHLLEVRGLLGEFQRRQHGEYIPPAARWDFSSYTGPAWLERNITAMQAIIPHLESRCLDKLRRSQPSSPNAPRPRGAIQ